MMIHCSFGHVSKQDKFQAQKIKNSNFRAVRILLCVEFLFAFQARA